MKQSWPLRLATWSLQRLAPRARSIEPLSGDLLEEWQLGRSTAWLWRQVTAALLSGWAMELHRMRLALVFGVLWSLPVPMLSFDTYDSKAGHWLFEKTIQMPWPASGICWFGAGLASGTFYACSGAVIYLLLRSLAVRRFDLGQAWRALPVAFAMYSVGIALALGLASLTFFPPIEKSSLTAWRFVADPRFLLMRLPTVISLFCAVYGATSKRVAGIHEKTGHAEPHTS
jgi:hypothetical protein